MPRPFYSPSRLLPFTPAIAQDAIQPGEAFVTRFSGTRPGAGGPVIDTNGTVGSIIDLRSPRMPPLGQHWVDEPQRKPVTAGQVGQVFGVALDDANPPNVYLTRDLGLRPASRRQRLDARHVGPGRRPRHRLPARRLDRLHAAAVLRRSRSTAGPNSGAALGNIAYDRVNKQLFVSDSKPG